MKQVIATFNLSDDIDPFAFIKWLQTECDHGKDGQTDASVQLPVTILVHKPDGDEQDERD